jgi:hypothetical protein
MQLHSQSRYSVACKNSSLVPFKLQVRQGYVYTCVVIHTTTGEVPLWVACWNKAGQEMKWGSPAGTEHRPVGVRLYTAGRGMVLAMVSVSQGGTQQIRSIPRLKLVARPPVIHSRTLPVRNKRDRGNASAGSK